MNERNVILIGFCKFILYWIRVVVFICVGEGVFSFLRRGKMFEDSKCECIVGF